MFNYSRYCTYFLQNFLLRVASHPLLSFDKHFIGFLQQKDGWRESIKESGMFKKNYYSSQNIYKGYQ